MSVGPVSATRRMTRDNRVRASLIEGMRDLQNLLVHLQTVLGECHLPIIRAGGGLTFSGFSIQVAPASPVDWIGYHIDRPGMLLYQIQDRSLPVDCSLPGLKQIQFRRYERSLPLDDPFFAMDERAQMDTIKQFVQQTVAYLKTLPPSEDEASQSPFIPVLPEK